jgi:[ribosomal protein S5]-alanine N-acetyltransferase
MTEDDEVNLFDADTVVATENFDLRPMRYADAPDLLTHFGDPETVEFMDIDALTTLEDARGVVRWADGVREFGEGLRWVVRDRATGAFIGTAGFNTLEVDRGRRGEIAYDLARDFWGKGVMSEILPAVIDIGFGALGLRRLEAFVTPGNQRSIRLLARHGFVQEGRLRDYGYWKDRFWDQLVFSRLSD